MEFSKRPIEQRYGVYVGVATALWIAFEYFLATVLNRPDLGNVTGFLAVIIPVLGVSYGLQALQKEKKKALTFKEAIRGGVYISAIAGAIAGAFVFLVIILYPQGVDSYVEYLRTTLEQAGESQETIDSVVEGVRSQFSPVLQAFYMLLGSIISGAVIAAIVWLFLRKQPIKK